MACPDFRSFYHLISFIDSSNLSSETNKPAMLLDLTFISLLGIYMIRLVLKPHLQNQQTFPNQTVVSYPSFILGSLNDLVTFCSLSHLIPIYPFMSTVNTPSPDCIYSEFYTLLTPNPSLVLPLFTISQCFIAKKKNVGTLNISNLLENNPSFRISSVMS